MKDQNKWWSETTQNLQYRCVCGTEFHIDLTSENCECPKCKRNYNTHAFKKNLGDSIATQSVRAITPSLATTIPQKQVSSELSSGDQLEHFKIVDVLGRGGMGAVYRAIDESLERYVALKVIDRHKDGSLRADYENLLQEARAQARLNHPNVVQIFYVQHKHHEKIPYFAMELVQGESLEERLTQEPMSFTQTIDIALQIVNALNHARAFDTIHGDIKPNNILFSSENTIKLADFGLSRKVSDNETKNSSFGGTPAYMPPEIIQGKSSDFRADMYSLGIMLYQMSFNKMPYKIRRKNLKNYLAAHQTAEINFPSKWPESIPTAWKEVIEKLLSKEPEGRYPNYDDLTLALKKLRPNQFPIAGRVTRGLAWLVDLSISLGLNSIFVLPLYSKIKFFEEHPVLRLPALALTLIVPYSVCFLQGYWKTTPGKKLFQLCIMDRHGKELDRSKLEARMAMQMLPLIIFNIPIFFRLLGPEQIGQLLLVIVTSLFFADLFAGIFVKARRSLHDWILGTQVVLDVSINSPEKEKQT